MRIGETMKKYNELTPVYVHGIDCRCEVDEQECDGFESLPTQEEFQQIVAAYARGDKDATPVSGWNIGAEASLQMVGAI